MAERPFNPLRWPGKLVGHDSPDRLRLDVVAGMPQDVADTANCLPGLAARVADLPPIHRDPFDRLLVAQAIEEPAILYTADARLPAYSELVRWVGAA